MTANSYATSPACTPLADGALVASCVPVFAVRWTHYFSGSPNNLPVATLTKCILVQA